MRMRAPVHRVRSSYYSRHIYKTSCAYGHFQIVTNTNETVRDSQKNLRYWPGSNKVRSSRLFIKLLSGQVECKLHRRTTTATKGFRRFCWIYQRINAIKMDRNNSTTHRRHLVTVFGLAVVLSVLMVVSNDAIKCASARYLPTRSDQSDVDVLKSLIHEVSSNKRINSRYPSINILIYLTPEQQILQSDADRTDLERYLYGRQQHLGRMTTSQSPQLISVQRRASLESGTNTGNIATSPLLARQIYSNSAEAAAEDR